MGEVKKGCEKLNEDGMVGRRKRLYEAWLSSERLRHFKRDRLRLEEAGRGLVRLTESVRSWERRCERFGKFDKE